MKKTLCTLLLAVFSLTAHSFDAVSLKVINDRDGLSENRVRGIVQDHQGFMWFGTMNGLNRYDGRTIRTIPMPDSGDPHTNKIRYMEVDSQGRLWIQKTHNRIACYDPTGEHFIDLGTEIPDIAYREITLASNGDTWLWGEQGVVRISIRHEQVDRWHPENEKPLNGRISNLFEDSEQTVWVGTDRELYRIKAGVTETAAYGHAFHQAHEFGGKIFFLTDSGILIFDQEKESLSTRPIPFDRGEAIPTRSALTPDGIILIAGQESTFAFDTHSLSFRDEGIMFPGKMPKNASFLKDNKGNIWVYNLSGVLWRYTEKHRFAPLELIPPHILSLITTERYSVYEDSQGVIWITTFGNGLFAIDTRNNSVHHYTIHDHLPTNYLYFVTEDRSGQIWVGTEFAGIVKMSRNSYPVQVFRPAENETEDRANAIRLIYEDTDNRFWFGTRNGVLLVYDADFKLLQRHRPPNGMPYTMAEAPDGTKWVGTKRGNGVLVFSPDGTRMIRTIRLADRSDRNTPVDIFCILRDRDERMWISTYGAGLYYAETATDQSRLIQIPMPEELLEHMRGMIQTRDGLIWIGTDQGLLVFDPRKIVREPQSFFNFKKDPKDETSLGHNEVKVVYEDRNGNLWIGTGGGGLDYLERKGSFPDYSFKHFTARNGLFNEMIQAIEEDSEGNIWVSTESGISRFDPVSEMFDNFFFSSNAHAAVYNERASWKMKNGNLMFGRYDGIDIFDPASINYDRYAPEVVLTNLWINGNEVHPNSPGSPLRQSISRSRELHLRHTENSFNIGFALMNFHAPDLNRYRFFLEGYEKEWNEISLNTTAAYRNVPPGRYTFRVRGSNSFGIWNECETLLHIVVHAPWWKSGWAFLVYFIFATSLILIAWRLARKMNKLHLEVEVEKRLTEHKLRFFTNISHEFKTPLTIIRGSVESLSEQKNLPPIVKSHIQLLGKSSSRLLKLIDQLLEFRKIQHDRMDLNLQLTEPAAFCRELFLSFKDLVEKKGITYSFEAEPDLPAVFLDQGKVEKILYNLLSNAFKNTPLGGSIVLRLTSLPEQEILNIAVSDSGPGISPEQQAQLFVRFQQFRHAGEGTGVGLHFTAELANVHQGTIAYTDSESGGACFTVSLPLSIERYNLPDDKETVLPIDKRKEAILPDEELTLPTESTINKPYKEYKIIIIEDDDDVREFLENQLKAWFTVFSLPDANDRIGKIIEEQPHVLVCDVMMPGMNGFEFTARLKKDPETSHIPVILLTAAEAEDSKLKGIESGADAYITKPFSMKYLLARIVKLIETREKLQKKFATEPGYNPFTIDVVDSDKSFLEKLHDLIRENLDNPDFKPESYVESLAISRTTFYRKLKALTGYAPNEYVRTIRLKVAAEMLLTTTLSVSEISYLVGFNDPLYFSKCFKNQFGISPTYYRKKI